MPELPEVETVSRQLNKAISGKTFKSVVVHVPKMVLPLSAQDFAQNISKKKVLGVSRRAKIVVISLSGKHFFLVHLKMTGQLIFVPKTGKAVVGGHPQRDGGRNLPNNYTQAEFKFTDGSTLYFNDLRKFGWLKLVTEAEKNIILDPHGAEPLDKKFTLNIFTELLTKYPNRTIKQTLFDQHLIAGMGNIYIDEASFLAKVLPTRKIFSLSKSEIEKLYKSMLTVLKLSIKMKGTSARNYVTSTGEKGGFVKYLNVYGRANLPCTTCGTKISKIKHAGRGTHFCEKCQK
ncbi:MAG: DNA-formamidopyrimidine glycosylase [Candidatus Vogelbacteria bacterium RIFOXYD1_FULL_44_32]|uniref:DNA-formamidopyrimidine glycosylase n=1 Tax=Candidatus Vogelbacteria bacterium RIFOXYD1_FULL_44_32 TaxID=1802438 RepID=A0A1G2QER3_9BACT|nr:MAG: DNA-formamidopyrimidine glycosylase [Candidatus Vogelbacteria bacterium RIFOXYD1_FULL_44_32]